MAVGVGVRPRGATMLGAIMALTTFYNGRATRRLIAAELRVTRELIEREEKATRGLIEMMERSTKELFRET